MKLSLLILLAAMATLPTSYAGCTGNITFTDDLVVREDFAVNPSQSASFVHQYTDPSCAGTNTVTRLKTSDVIVGFYNNTVKLNLKISWLDDATIRLTDNQKSFTAGYKVDISQASNNATVNISADSGGGVRIDNVASLSSASSTSRNTAFWVLIGCLLSGGGWEACINNYRNSLSDAGGFYSSNLKLTYNRKQTTCKPENLTIALPDISLAELPASGKTTSKNATDNIRLQCENLFGDRKQTSRKMVVYLSSGDLLAGSNTVLRGDANNGVGFVLENSNKIVNISDTPEQGTATTLWKVDKVGDAVNNNTVTIPVVASYYVYDRSKIKPGELKATALIYVKYD
ncbi:putative fimbrial-like adhesin protein [Citrobacter sp. CK198]|uniref:putative fimbrial-like adhesin protein n=1 Tax=Citrobacter TaxID=544 RepID=UPI00106FBA2E|nr:MULTISPECIES: putative fimbrial-like adhesin protein [Citrobacter]MBJ8874462.1 putative fimbrial-like adhesin protein [Citrobacter koseri]MDM2974519.1 putative fimbrial-like adhesin protein [Citrobacter sp. CK198]VFS06472.1 fimbrial adhesin [Citrobacter koseri]